jgi:cation transport regulator ChaC
MRVLACLGLLLSVTAAQAQGYSTVINRETKSVTTTAPNGTTATTTQAAQTSSGTTYVTTISHPGYQPMGAKGYRPTGDYHPMGR